MNKQEFLDLIKSQTMASAADAERLGEVVANFPYCQAAHVLIAKIAYQQSSMLAKQKLNKAAAYVMDRKVLKTLLTRNSITVPETMVRELPPTSELVPVQEALPEIVPAPEKNDSPIVVNEEKKEEEVSETVVLANDSPPVMVVQEDVPVSEKELLPEIAFPSSSPAEQQPELINAEEDERSPLPIQSRSAFFQELEKNLENLRNFKEKNDLTIYINTPFDKVKEEGIKAAREETREEEAKTNDIKELPQEEIIAEEEQPILTQPVRQSIRPEKADAAVFGTSKQLAIDSSRLEEVMTASAGNIPVSGSQQEMLAAYLQYLSTRKKAFFRSKDKMNSIIERFITEEPSMPYLKARDRKEMDEIEDLSEDSTKTSNHIASENFAKILVRQGKYKKAIAIYEELILKNPEKNAYLAALIEELNSKL